jgi:hypothetical protein
VSQIAQVQITFVPGEDRLLLRVASGTAEEFRFWLTRRFVRALRPQLEKTLSEQPRIRSQVNPDARRELLRFEHEQAKETSDFATPFQDGAAKTLPLGAQPVLLTRFQLRSGDDGALVLGLRPEAGHGIDLNLNAQLAHSLLALMDNASRGAQWDLHGAGATAVESHQGSDASVLN